VAAQVKIAIGVMAHRDRDRQAWNLFHAVEGDKFSMDGGSLGENANGDNVWRMLGETDADWCIVLQDDAVPIADFRKHAASVLAESPDTAVSFYVGTCMPRAYEVQTAVERANDKKASFLEADNLLWGVAVAMRRERIGPFLEWAKHNKMPYDSRIGAYFNRTSTPVRYSWPSLVDHRDGPSIVDQYTSRKPRECERVAHRVGVPFQGGPVIRIARPR